MYDYHNDNIYDVASKGATRAGVRRKSGCSSQSMYTFRLWGKTKAGLSWRELEK